MPVTAECRVEREQTGQIVEAVHLPCPADAPEADTLLADADAVAAQFGLPYTLPE